MAKYVLLSRFTQQGLETIKDGPARLDAARETLRGLGAELKDFYLTIGGYDVVVVLEAPDDGGHPTVATVPKTHGLGTA